MYVCACVVWGVCVLYIHPVIDNAWAVYSVMRPYHRHTHRVSDACVVFIHAMLCGFVYTWPNAF